MHPECLRLYRGVLEEPGDTLRRAILADALEECGEQARAEFVRVQLLLDAPALSGLAVDHARLVAGRRELELLRQHWHRWCFRLPFLVEHFGHGPAYLQPTVHPGRPDITQTFQGGFVSSIQVKLADLDLQTAALLFENHPVASVTLTDRQPYRQPYRHDSASFSWWPSGGSAGSHLGYPDRLPEWLFCRLRGRAGAVVDSVFYDTEVEALRDLSRACVAWGRSLAGWPEETPPASRR